MTTAVSHSARVSETIARVQNTLKNNCLIFTEYSLMTKIGKKVVDVVVMEKKRFELERQRNKGLLNYGTVPPNICIEVLSPANKAIEMMSKANGYLYMEGIKKSDKKLWERLDAFLKPTSKFDHVHLCDEVWLVDRNGTIHFYARNNFINNKLTRGDVGIRKINNSLYCPDLTHINIHNAPTLKMRLNRLFGNPVFHDAKNKVSEPRQIPVRAK